MLEPDQNNQASLEVLREASDPRTAQDRLKRLASHRDERVREQVAGNPNAPTDALYRLCVRHPEAFLKNPVLELLILENPNLLVEMPEYARSSVLSCEDAPMVFLEWSEKWNEGLLAVLRNPNAPKALLERLADHAEERVAQAAKLHVNTGAEAERDPLAEAMNAMSKAALERDGEMIKDLFALEAVPVWALELLCQDSDAELRALAAAHPDAPPAVLERLAVDEEEPVRQRAVAHRNASGDWSERYRKLQMMEALEPERVEGLAGAGSWARKLAARHPNAPLALIVGLASDEDWRVREAVALNPQLPFDTLEALFNDSDRDVRAAAASHPKATVAQLERLAGDTDERVRQAIAAHPNAPQRLIEHLERAASNDPSLNAQELQVVQRYGEWGRQIAAAHPNADRDTLERLSRDEVWRVRQAVGHNPCTTPTILEGLAQDSDSDVRGAVAQNPSAPLHVLETLSLDAHNEVRKSVAQNPNASAAILERLGADDHWTVRQAVASHANAPDGTLVMLVRDADRDVRQALIERLALPEAVLEALFAGWPEPINLSTDRPNDLYRRALQLDPDLPDAFLASLAVGEEWARLLVARHANAPQSALEHLSSDNDWRVRQAVAQNSSAPWAVLARMLDDHDADVRTAVASHANVPQSALERLAHDAHTGVRTAVLAREDAPQAALETLAGDEEEEVRRRAQADPRVPRELVEGYARAEAQDTGLEPAALEALSLGGAWARGLAARHPNTPQNALVRLATDERWVVRQAVAGNSSAGATLLASMAADSDLDVRRSLAGHPNTPQDALETLLHDAEDGVRRAALGNPNLSAELRIARRRRAIGNCARAKEGLNRAIGLSHPDVPESELMKSRHLASGEWLERLALALNPTLPQAGIERLSRDGNRIVRAVAKSRLEKP